MEGLSGSRSPRIRTGVWSLFVGIWVRDEIRDDVRERIGLVWRTQLAGLGKHTTWIDGTAWSKEKDADKHGQLAHSIP